MVLLNGLVKQFCAALHEPVFMKQLFEKILFKLDLISRKKLNCFLSGKAHLSPCTWKHRNNAASRATPCRRTPTRVDESDGLRRRATASLHVFLVAQARKPSPVLPLHWSIKTSYSNLHPSDSQSKHLNSALHSDEYYILRFVPNCFFSSLKLNK